MRPTKRISSTRLEELPNIGKSIASDLRAIGILHPDQLADRDPLAIFIELAGVMEHRHDPCVLYTLISAKHFIMSGEVIPWWKFTEQGKQILKSNPQKLQKYSP